MTQALDIDPEQGLADHTVPPDLLELHEALEFLGLIDIPAVAKMAPSHFVTRAAWGARPSRGATPLHNPPGVTLHYEGPRMGSFPHSACASKVRGIQNFHMDARGWNDSAYNLMACPHGYVYELRGRDVRSAANGTNTGNSSSHAVCALIGEGDIVTDDLLRGIVYARSWLMEGGTGNKTHGHQDWKPTSCPGGPLYAWHRAGWTKPDRTAPPVDPPVDPTRKQCTDAGGHPTLRLGAEGRSVNHLQYFLIKSGATIKGDGDFGPATDGAVRAHQQWLHDHRNSKVVSDGVVGPITWQAIHDWADGLRV